MVQKIATGVVDIQLIGLPDVKRQIEGVPKLMDGVARASIGFGEKMRKAYVSGAARGRAEMDEMSQRIAQTVKSIDARQDLIVKSRGHRSNLLLMKNDMEAWAAQNDPQTQKLLAKRRSYAVSGRTNFEAATNKLIQRRVAELESQFDPARIDAAVTRLEAKILSSKQKKKELQDHLAKLESSMEAQPDHAGYRGRQAQKKVFDRSMFGELRQFREAATGMESLKILEQERQALDRVATAAKRRGEIEPAVHRAFVQSIKERIRLSEEAIRVEQLRVMDPQAFERHRRFKDAQIATQESFSGFRESQTHEEAIRLLEERRAAVSKLAGDERIAARERIRHQENRVAGLKKRSEQDVDRHGQKKSDFRRHGELVEYQNAQRALESMSEAEKDAESIRKAFTDQSQEAIDKELALRHSHAEINKNILTERANRQSLIQKRNEAANALGKEHPEVRRYNEAIAESSRKIKTLTDDEKKTSTQLNEFNKELQDGGQHSKRYNYRMQQLSFAAQDAVQVYGQTGLAGALHASANNMSMFVQTMEGVTPAMAGLAAFGVTAAMMGLSAWLHASKKDADALIESLQELYDLEMRQTERRQSNRELSKGSTGDFESALKSASDKVEVLTSQMNRLQDEYSQMQGDSLNKFTSSFYDRAVDEATRRGRRAMITGDKAEIDAAQKAFRDVWNVSIEAQRAMFGQDIMDRELFEERVGRNTFDAIKKTLMDRGAAEDEATSEAKKYSKVIEDLRQAMADKAAAEREITRQSNRVVQSYFQKGGERFSSRLSEIAGSGDDLNLRKMQIAEALSGFSSEDMTDTERKSADFRGAIQRLAKEYRAHVNLMRAAGANQFLLDQRREEYNRAYESVTEAAKAHAEQSADAFRRLMDGLSHLDPLAEKLKAIDEQVADFLKDNKDPARATAVQQAALAAKQRARREDLSQKASDARTGIESAMQSFASSLSDEDQTRFREIFANAQRIKELDNLAVPDSIKAGLRNLSVQQMRSNIAGPANRQIGLSDPQSLHKQIQLSLRGDNKTTELQKQANKILTDMLSLWERESEKEKLSIGN